MGAAQHPQSYEMSPEEGRQLLDREAHEHFGISGEEFARKWDAGEFDDEEACPEAVRVAMLIPFAR